MPDVKIAGATYRDVETVELTTTTGSKVLFSVGGSGDTNIDSKTATGKGSTTLSFTEMKGQPKWFELHSETQFNGSATRCVTHVFSNGTQTFGNWNYQQRQNGWCINYFSGSYFSFTYSNGTLTVRTSSSTNGGVFRSSTTYRLTYGY